MYWVFQPLLWEFLIVAYVDGFHNPSSHLMRQVPLESDGNIAVNGLFLVCNLHQERAIYSNVLSGSRGTCLIFYVGVYFGMICASVHYFLGWKIVHLDFSYYMENFEMSFTCLSAGYCPLYSYWCQGFEHTMYSFLRTRTVHLNHEIKVLSFLLVFKIMVLKKWVIFEKVLKISFCYIL